MRSFSIQFSSDSQRVNNNKMAKKTVKDLNIEITQLQEELQELKVKFDTLENKYVSLEKMYEKKMEYRCKSCDQCFKTFRDLKCHMRNHVSMVQVFKCEKCEHIFNEEWKLQAHQKSHNEYKCEQCEKTFKYEDIKQKHIKISHEHFKIYCNFYNNRKTCPFGDNCVFVHEKSEPCKYGELCERENCMYIHETCDDDENGDDYEEVDDNVNEAERTFLNPYNNRLEECDASCDDVQGKNDMKDKNDEQSETNNDVDEKVIWKCEVCKYESDNKRRFDRHTFENHSVPGKYVCIQCKQEFDTRKKFNSHNYHGCG